MTDYELVGSIRRSLHAIRDHWTDMLEPTGSGGIAKAPAGTVTMADDHAETDADTPRIDVIVSLRREVTEYLNDWARLIVEGRNVTATIPNGLDTIALATFIDTHADWLAEHPAGQDAAKEIRALAGRVRQKSGEPEIGERDELVMPAVHVGVCPVQVDGRTCGARVRAYVGLTQITCRGCCTADTLDWWMAQIAPEGADLANADGVIGCVAGRIGEVLTHEQVRQWASRGLIQRHGKDTKGRTLYSSAAVLAYAQHQTKEQDVA